MKKKTKYMVVFKHSRPKSRKNISLNELNFEVIRKLKYPGALITADNRVENDVSARIISENRALYSFQTLWRYKLLERQASQLSTQ